MKQGILFSLSIIFAILGCRNEKPVNFTIKGNINGNHPDKILLYEFTNTGILPYDSSDINKNGDFKLKGSVSVPSFFLLKIKGTKGITLSIHPKENIKLYIQSANFDIDYIVEGSIDSRRICQLIQQQDKSLQKITKISIEYEISKSLPDFIVHKKRIDSIYNIIFSKHKQFSIDFIKENPCSFASLMALYQSLGANVQVFNITEDFKYFELVDSCMTGLYATSDAVQNLNYKVVEAREMLKTSIGFEAPEINLPDTSGNKITLSSLKGKTVLINFEASWCSECRINNAKLITLYTKFKNKNFEILDVSLDKTRISWIKAIKEDKSAWKHVCDLKFWNSKAATSYYVNKLPCYYIIDENGKIVGNNIPFELLEPKLTDIYTK